MRQPRDRNIREVGWSISADELPLPSTARDASAKSVGFPSFDRPAVRLDVSAGKLGSLAFRQRVVELTGTLDAAAATIDRTSADGKAAAAGTAAPKARFNSIAQPTTK